MDEKIEKAEQGAAMLVDDLRAIYVAAIHNNEALVILAHQLIESAAKIRDTLALLKRL